MKLEYIVKSDKYKSIKEVLKAHFHMSDRFVLKLKRNNRILLNGENAFTYSSIKLGDVININLDFEEKSENIVPTKMDLEIIFEDKAMLILNKPAGLPVHPSMSHYENSLSNGIRYYFEKNNIFTKIRPVNRLDKDTSGLVIFAKSEYVQECLIRQMANKTFEKYYLAILCGNLDKAIGESGTLDARIARKAASIIEREINENGQTAITHYKLIKNYSDFCLVEFKLETGRTHQIRVHSKHIGHPILGDTLYGTSSELINRQALHAYKISFVHPITNQKMNFEIELPEDMKKVLKKEL